MGKAERDGRRFAGQDLAYVDRRHVVQAHRRDDGVGVARVEDVLLAELGLAAEAARAQQHLVVGEVGRLEDHLDAVRQRQQGQAERLVGRLGDDAAGRRRLFHQACGDWLLVTRRHRRLGRGVGPRQQLRAGRGWRFCFVRAHVDHQLGGIDRDSLARVRVHFGQRNPRDEFARVVVFVLDAGNFFLFQEVADVFRHIRARIGLVTLAVGALVEAQQVLLGALELRGAEAELARPFVFLHQRGNRRRGAVFAERGGGGVRLVARGEWSQPAAGAHEGRIGLLRQFAQPLAEHRPEQRADHLFAHVGEGIAVVGLAHRVADHHGVAGCFLVGDDQRFGRRAHRNRRGRARACERRIFQAGEVRHDQLLGIGRFDVADYHHRHQVGTIPVAVEAFERIGLERFEDGVLADRQPLRVARAVVKLRHQHLVHPVARAFALARLVEDDVALLVDVGIVQRQAMGPVFQHREALVDVTALVGGDRQDVDGFVEAGVGVQVGAPLDPDRLQVRHQFVFLEVGRAIEGHMLDEVGQPLLVVVFEHRAGLDHQAQFELLFRLAVLLDVVGQAVGQFAHFDLRADRDRVGQPDLGQRGRCGDDQEGCEAGRFQEVFGHRGAGEMDGGSRQARRRRGRGRRQNGRFA